MADDSPCPRIGIVVVNFHAPDLTLACLERLEAMDGRRVPGTLTARRRLAAVVRERGLR